MQEFISFDVLVNWVQMLRANIDGAIVLADDEEESRFYERLIHPSAQVIPAFHVACPLLERVNELGIEGVIAAARRSVDAEQPGDIFCPTLGDVASLLLNSSSCQAAVSDVCGAAWLQAGGKEFGSILTRVVELARQFKQLLALSEENGKSLTIQEFIDGIDWKNLKVKLEEVRPFTGEGRLMARAEDLMEAFIPAPLEEGLIECDGMDAVYILAAATHFLKPRGISSARKVDRTELLGLLRSVFNSKS